MRRFALPIVIGALPLTVFGALLWMGTRPPAPVTPPVLAYYLDGETSVPIAPLPDTFVIEPGIYATAGENYDMRRGGLYRVTVPGQWGLQRCVVTSADALLTCVAWASAHGSADDGLSVDAVMNAARTRKLSLTCGNVVRWALTLLTDAGYEARAVQLRGNTRNGWNDGHVVIEVVIDGAWVVYDVDANVQPHTPDGAPMTAEAFAAATQTGAYNLRRLAGDGWLDPSGFGEWSLFIDSAVYDESTLRALYAQVAATVEGYGGAEIGL